MKVEVLRMPIPWHERPRRQLPADARAAIAARGRFALAVSGGHAPWIMLRVLSHEEIPWAGVHVFQTDERVAPTDTRIGTLRTCEKACFSMHLCARADPRHAGRSG